MSRSASDRADDVPCAPSAGLERDTRAARVPDRAPRTADRSAL